MNQKRFLLPVLVLALLLSACGVREQPDEPPAPPPAPVEPAKPAAPPEEPAALGPLTVEVVVDGEEAERLLERLEDLSALLNEGLLERGYAPEEVVITISTAGGVTADALCAGGVDAACLPAADYLAAEEQAAAVLTTDDGTAVAAVAAGREELDEAFRGALAGALTESGFLEACCPGRTYLPASEEALQALRDRAAEEGGHGA